MTSPKSTRIEILSGVTTTYGVGGDVKNNELPTFNSHRVRVESGSISVSYIEQGGEVAQVVDAAVTDTNQDIYDLTNVSQFSFTATGDSVLVITSYQSGA